MNFIEATEHMMVGKKVCLSPGCSLKIDRRNGRFVWEYPDRDVIADIVPSDVQTINWRLVEPKRYSFTEAYAMMKAGKWMRPVSGDRTATRFDPKGFVWTTTDGVGVYPLMPAFDICEIDAKWEEVIP